MASSAENSNSFTSPTIPSSSVIPTQWHSISGRVSIVRFGDGASAFCWLEQRWLSPTDYQFTLSLVSPWLFPPSFFFIFYFCYFFIFYFLFFILTSVLSIFKLFIYLFSSSFFLSLLRFLFFYPHLFFLFLISVSSTLYHLSMHIFVMSIDSNFVLEFIARVMMIMVVHSIYQKWTHVRHVALATRVHVREFTSDIYYVLTLSPWLTQ